MRRLKLDDFSEADLASVVVESLEDMGWEVFQEVQAGGSGGVADIVARLGKLLWVIEVKKSLGLPVMAQAWRWRWQAHYVSVAVPLGKYRDNTYALAGCLLADNGIGLLEVDYRNRTMTATRHAKLMRTAHVSRLASNLVEEQKHYAKAGTHTGRHYTKWGATRDRLVSYVFSHPGCTLKDALGAIEHHYHSNSAALSSMAQLILARAIPAIKAEHVEVEREATLHAHRIRGRKPALRLYPVEYITGPVDVPDGARTIGFWEKYEAPDLYVHNRVNGGFSYVIKRYLSSAQTFGALGSGFVCCPVCKSALPYEQRLTQDKKWVFPSVLEHLFSRHNIFPSLPEFLMDAESWRDIAR